MENNEKEIYLYEEDVLPNFLKFSTIPIKEQIKSEYEQKILKIKKEFYISGNKKKELAEWYLELIENQTDKFLIEEDSFNFSVIPVMYLDTPPSSMSEIDRDLIIVRKHMDNLSFTKKENNNQQPQPQSLQQQQPQQPKQHNTLIYNKLVSQLIIQVHRLIDIFIKESLCILYNELSDLSDQYSIDIFLNNPLVPLNHIEQQQQQQQESHQSNEQIKIYNTMKLNNEFDFNKFQNNCKQIIERIQRKQQQNKVKEINFSPLIELLKDTNHLNKMQQYDKDFFSMDHSILSADDPVVGVTGFVLNRLHRLENELKTIQQHWNSTSINSFNQNYQTSSLRR
ncbi:hypothetical protein DDB_G0277159 [Dictyostelium discoideum AX4]|uniref:Uncharacterized protein n=1 Tax=Dictyostelium discoideum TaxID=44689 RepID=Q76NZ9_DICDI|nr:hypothetical protein DDB_G0277159 [Dictyostelium discoideum AX4]EAL68765.1 hypothetical protein DDB_G0277159 [Dictyostelium discoideum AX4]|eukprot:XP_642795.1 hypothetical protein DDB_G0277159 [Dictyostelium discoideum AX4]